MWEEHGGCGDVPSTTTFTQLAHFGSASSPRSDVMKTRLTISRMSRAFVCSGFCQYSFELPTQVHVSELQTLG